MMSFYSELKKFWGYVNFTENAYSVKSVVYGAYAFSLEQKKMKIHA